MKRKATVIAALLLVTATTAFAGQQSCEGARVRDAADFVFIAEGVQVHDQRTGLIWLRCLEGQEWNGTTCVATDPEAVNPGPRMTYAQARRFAATRSRRDEAWRLPTKRELLSLREPACSNPSFSLEVFPTQPAWSSDGSFWTSTPEGKGVALVSAIGTSDSWSATDASRMHHVRLVRTATKDGATGAKPPRRR